MSGDIFQEIPALSARQGYRGWSWWLGAQYWPPARSTEPPLQGAFSSRRNMETNEYEIADAVAMRHQIMSAALALTTAHPTSGITVAIMMLSVVDQRVINKSTVEGVLMAKMVELARQYILVSKANAERED